MVDLLTAVEGTMPVVWYKLRIRLNDEIYDPVRDKNRYKHFETALHEFFDIIQKYALEQITSGLEVHNKRGQYTYPHLPLIS